MERRGSVTAGNLASSCVACRSWPCYLVGARSGRCTLGYRFTLAAGPAIGSNGLTYRPRRGPLFDEPAWRSGSPAHHRGGGKPVQRWYWDPCFRDCPATPDTLPGCDCLRVQYLVVGSLHRYHLANVRCPGHPPFPCLPFASLF